MAADQEVNEIVEALGGAKKRGPKVLIAEYKGVKVMTGQKGYHKILEGIFKGENLDALVKTWTHTQEGENVPLEDLTPNDAGAILIQRLLD